MLFITAIKLIFKLEKQLYILRSTRRDFMAKKLLFVLSLSLMVLLVACGGNKQTNTDVTQSQEAESTNNETEEKKVLKVGVAAAHQPWCYLGENNEVIGVDPTILEEIARRNGWEVEYIISDFSGMFGNLDTGKVDTVAQQISATPARAEKYLFSEIYAYNPYKLYVRNESDITGVKDLKGHSFVCGPASIEHEWITSYKAENDPNDEIEVLITDAEKALTVNSGKGDAGGYPIVVFDDMIEKTGYELKQIGDVIYNENNIYPFRKDVNQEFFDDFNSTLKQMKEEGFLRDLYMEHFGVDLSIDGSVE